MDLEVIRDSARLAEFVPEWSVFARSQPSLTPFQLPEWQVVWWAHFGSGELQILVFREQSCAGVIPCFLHSWNDKQQLTLLGSGISDYLDPLLDPVQEAAILKRLVRHLQASTNWDLCDWQDLAYSTPLRALLEVFDGESMDNTLCSEAPLARTFDHFWQGRSPGLRRNVRRYSERAQQDGTLNFAATGTADPELIDALIRLHAARWNVRGESGMIEANHSAGFLFEIARKFADLGILRILSLRYQDRIAALILGFVHRGKMYGYLSAFDPLYHHLSFGSVLLHRSFRDCYEQGLLAWNFMRGDESYKFAFGAETLSRVRLVLRRS